MQNRTVKKLNSNPPYHPGCRGLNLPQMTLRPIKMAQCASPTGTGRMRSVSRCRWCTATASFLLAVRVCSVCKREGREIEGLVPVILQARSVRWVSLRPCTANSSQPASSVIQTLTHTRGPGALRPGSSGLSQI